MKRVHILISGKVISVFFRSFIEGNANKLNIKGWVRNTQEDKVEAIFEGKESSIDQLIKLCKSGPKSAIVNNIKLKEEPYQGEFDDFQIIY